MGLINFREERHRADIDEKYHQLNVGNIGRVMYWQNFFNMIKGVEGDIVECGIGRGRSLLIIAAINSMLVEKDGGQRQIFGYDSFEGFPEPTVEDMSPRNPQKGEWSKSPSGRYTYSEEFILQVLESADVSLYDQSITLTKGFFSDSLRSHPERPISLLHIDSDLYLSYLSVLESLFRRVSPGGIIVFDDFRNEQNHIGEPFPGSRHAVSEFLGDNVSKLKTSILGTYYLKLGDDS